MPRLPLELDEARLTVPLLLLPEELDGRLTVPRDPLELERDGGSTDGEEDPEPLEERPTSPLEPSVRERVLVTAPLLPDEGGVLVPRTVGASPEVRVPVRVVGRETVPDVLPVSRVRPWTTPSDFPAEPPPPRLMPRSRAPAGSFPNTLLRPTDDPLDP